MLRNPYLSTSKKFKLPRAGVPTHYRSIPGKPNSTSLRSQPGARRHFSALRNLATTPTSNTDRKAESNEPDIIYLDSEKPGPSTIESDSRDDDILIHPNFIRDDYIDDDDLDSFLDKQNLPASYSPRFPPTPRKLSSKALALQRDNKVRRGLLSESQLPLDSYLHGDVKIITGGAVELTDGTFLKVVAIIQDTESSEVTLRGQRFRRVDEFPGWLENHCNEVCWEINMDEDDSRDFREQSIVEASVNTVIQKRRVRLTNHLYPRFNAKAEFPDLTNEDIIVGNGVLVCRLLYIRKWPTGEARRLKRPCEWAFIRIPQEDADAKCRADNDDLRKDFRGETIKGGDHIGMRPDEDRHLKHESQLRVKAMDEYSDTIRVHTTNLSRSSSGGSSSTSGHRSSSPITLDSDESDFEIDIKFLETVPEWNFATDPTWQETGKQMMHPPTKGSLQSGLQRYTIGDGFCGCGGVTRSAVMAGLSPLWAFDFNPEAIRSFRTSFPYARAGLCSAFDFATNPAYWMKVDILHLSPPCQFYSPAHTGPGKDDEANTAASFVVGKILSEVKPRIVTLEETFGLDHEQHRPYLKCIIQQCTAAGFSVRYKVLKLVNYGVPQNRKRLLLIASW